MNDVRNGADAICSALLDCGVDTVFGVPGTQTVALYEALRRARIRTVTATQEMAATFMAQGYYRASGRLAAVSTIPGPGFAFTLAALAEAKLDSAAVLLLTGSPPSCNQGRKRSQAIDQAAMARPVVKGIVDVSAGSEVSESIAKASHMALSGEPGPVLVQVSQAVYSDAPGTPVTVAREMEPGAGSDPGSLREAASLTARAERLLVYAGQGAAGASDRLRRLLTETGALLATTPSGRGLLPEHDDHLIPLDSTGDVAGFNSVVAECDLVVVLGAGLAENGTVGFGIDLPAERLLRVDASSEVLARPPGARIKVHASVEAFLAAVQREIDSGGNSCSGKGFDHQAARIMRARLKARSLDIPSEPRIAGGDAHGFFEALGRALPQDGCLVLDSGMHQLLARRHYVVRSPRGLIFPSDFQSMAFGLPAAIGAKLASPDKRVVALLGDGGLGMTGLELTTAARLELGLPVVVFDDGALGLIRLDQLLGPGRTHGTTLGGSDFEALAHATGAAYARADLDSIEALVRSAFDRSGPTLIAVPVRDAPALSRLRAKRSVRSALKSLAGKRITAAYRRLRGRV